MASVHTLAAALALAALSPALAASPAGADPLAAVADGQAPGAIHTTAADLDAALAALAPDDPQAAAKPAAGRGPRIAALVPPNEDIILGTRIQRAVGIERAYQPAIGVYCFVPKTGVKIGGAVPTLTVDLGLSTGTGNRAQWVRDPAKVGCKPGELAAVTLTADGKGGLKLTTTVGFAIVVS